MICCTARIAEIPQRSVNSVMQIRRPMVDRAVVASLKDDDSGFSMVVGSSKFGFTSCSQPLFVSAAFKGAIASERLVTHRCITR
ncbi:unnamed protein product [Protopolystoma xenopodis]|uniref:Uncharacterized protein n=1 Tax=Protopolystoma xenopodis TaxID=117903 RepID=A0A3S5C7Z9_9PLAT|nr:unnamed protein product [Protopolystoma xenopodis]